MNSHTWASGAGFAVGSIAAFIALSVLLPFQEFQGAPPVPPARPDETPQSAEHAVAPSRAPAVRPAHVAASFEVIENVSTSSDSGVKRRNELEQFVFPPMNFRWQGPAQSLAPAFRWEPDSAPAEGPADADLPQNYSSKLAIRISGSPGILRLHLNVVARLKDWLAELNPAELKQKAPIEVRIEAPRDREVVLSAPAIGHAPAHTFVVRL